MYRCRYTFNQQTCFRPNAFPMADKEPTDNGNENLPRTENGLIIFCAFRVRYMDGASVRANTSIAIPTVEKRKVLHSLPN